MAMPAVLSLRYLSFYEFFTTVPNRPRNLILNKIGVRNPPLHPCNAPLQCTPIARLWRPFICCNCQYYNIVFLILKNYTKLYSTRYIVGANLFQKLAYFDPCITELPMG